MATPVPYTGRQEVTPQQGFLPQAHEDTPVAAFGGAVAGAITHMGEVAQGAGKELFDRAYAFQELHEQNKADAASADAFDKQTDRYLQFEQLKGAERTPEAFNQYKQDLEKIRSDGVEGLDSPYAKAQYLRDSRRNQSMMLWHGGQLATQGMDEATQAALKGKINAAGDALSTVNAKGPELDAGIAGIKGSAASLVHHQTGYAPGSPQNNDLAAPAVSSQIAKIVIARSDADPVDGKAFGEAMHNKGQLSQEDYDKLKPVLESRVLNKTGGEIARDVLSGYDPTAKQNDKDVEAQARAAAEKKDPGNKGLADQAAIKALTLKDHIDDLKFKSEKQDRDILFQGIDGTNTKDGKVPVSLDQAEADPEWKARYDKLTPPSQFAVQEIIRRNQNLGGVVHNTAGDLQYFRLSQIIADRATASPADLQSVADADFLSKDYQSLTRDQRQSLLKGQSEIINQVVQNPNMSHAMSLGSVQQMLKDAQIDQASNPTEYAKFKTAYHDAVVAYGLGAERSVKNDGELADIATHLINKQTSSWLHPTTWRNNNAQPYSSIIDFSEADKTIGLRAYKRQFGTAADLDDPAQKELVNNFALQLRFNAMGKSSGGLDKPKATDRVTP